MHEFVRAKGWYEPDSIHPQTPRNLAAWEVLITETGADVIEGKQDWIKINGIDRWMGGVHLAKGKPMWRWDEDEQKLVKVGST